MLEPETDYQRWLKLFYVESPQLLPRVIPNDLVWHIFLLLPVKCLLRMKCVCKSWNSIISGTLFAKNHLRRSIQDPTLTNHHLFQPVENPNHIIFLSYSIKSVFNQPLTYWECIRNSHLPFKHTEYTILGCCHSFICFMSKKHMGETHMRLSNPTTRVVSPESPSMGVCIGEQYVCYGPYYSSQVVERGVQKWEYAGFGYDAVSEKYKAVVIFRHNYNRWITTTKVYSFGNMYWTTYYNPRIRGYPTMIEWGAAFLDSNSTLNWLAIDTVPRLTSSGRVGPTYIIVNFYLTAERIGNICLPARVFNTRASNLELGVLKGYLSIFRINEQISKVNIWMMLDYGITESWAHMISVPYSGTTRPPTWPICMSEKGEFLLKKRRSIIYNPITDRMRFPVFKHLERRYPVDNHFIYIEGLLSPNF